MAVALVTGASRGLGLALTRTLARRGFRLVIDARGGDELQSAARELGQLTEVIAIPGDVTDAWHREALVDAAGSPLDLLVNNASVLGPSPQPALADYPLRELERVYCVNVLAPLALTQLALPAIRPGGAIVNVTSDAAIEPYEGWGGYGSSKAALEQLSAILAAERPELRIYAVDPATCAPGCIRRRFPARTSPIVRRRSSAFPGC
jgi:NAD(P)-dependent dehydrogenase (short-subunit alcohol dehydrogenase family)